MVDSSFTEYFDNLPDIVDILPEKKDTSWFQSFKVSKFDFVEPFAHSLKFEPFRRSNIGSSSMTCSARVHHLFLVLVMWAEISADITGRNFGWLYNFLRKLPCNFVKRNETITLTITLTSWKMSGTCPCGRLRRNRHKSILRSPRYVLNI